MYSGHLLIGLINADQLVYRSSTRRLERKLDKLVAEIRAGKRQGSVISTQSLESLSTDEKSLWRELRHEMEDVGISTAVIMDRKEFIIEWFKTAIAQGGLDEIGDLSDDENLELDKPSSSIGASNNIQSPGSPHRQQTLSTGSGVSARSHSPFGSTTVQFPASPVQTVAVAPRNGAGAGANSPAQRSASSRGTDAFQQPRKIVSRMSSIKMLFRGLSRALKSTEELEETVVDGDTPTTGLNLLYSPEGNHEIE